MPTLLLQKPVGLMRLRELCDEIELEEKLSGDFFRESPDLLAVIGCDGLFVQSSASWNKILGWLPDEMSLFCVVHNDDKEILLETFCRLKTQNVDRVLCRIHRADGDYNMVEFSATQWHNGLSNFIGRIINTCQECAQVSPRLNWRADGCNNCESHSD